MTVAVSALSKPDALRARSVAAKHVPPSAAPRRRRRRSGVPCSDATTPLLSMGPCGSATATAVVRFAEAVATTIPGPSASHAATWYDADDYSGFQQDRRAALVRLRRRLRPGDAGPEAPLDVAELIGVEAQLDLERFLARKLECLGYVRLVVATTMTTRRRTTSGGATEAADALALQTALRGFAADAGRAAYRRAVVAVLLED